MSLPVYPTLSVNPEFPIITEPLWDTSITSYGGKIEQRKANITQEKLRFRFKYKHINNDDKALLEGFFKSRRGIHEKFTWTNPETALQYTVNFKNEALDIQYYRYGIWNIGEIILIEAI